MHFLRLLILLFAFCEPVTAASAPAVALYYGKNIAVSEFRAFDIVVVEPDHGHDPRRRQAGDGELYAYVSVAEVQVSRPYYKGIPATWKLARNNDWDAEVIDQTPADWPAFFADKVVGPLWAKGYRGFFLDTLDSYRLAKKFDEAAQQDGLVRVIETLHQRFPGIQLILNRGFEIVPRVRDKVRMVAAESLYQGWNASARRYEPVKASDRDWLLGQLQSIRQRYGIDILAIDYIAPQDRKLARETAEKIRSLGFIPWVTDSALDSIGVGSIEAVPRRVLVLYNGAESPSLNYSNAHRFLHMPLNHLGYVVDFIDARQALPKDVYRDRYAGIVTWFTGQLPAANGSTVLRWLLARQQEGMPLAILGDFGFVPDSTTLGRLGLKNTSTDNIKQLRVAGQHPMLGFETRPQPGRNELTTLQLADSAGRALIELEDQRGMRYVAGALMPWGAYLLDPYVLNEIPGSEQARWVVDPFAFLQAALRLPSLPVPDTTTENGRRLFFSHIDGDGFASRAEFPGSPLAAEVLLKEVLEKYRIPTTMSVIESEVAPHGLYPKQSAEMEEIARRMFRLPHVEIASHTWSHPFLWDRSVRHGIFSEGGEAAYSLDIPGYKFDLTREIVGSSDYIRQRLAPPGKPVRILLWSGDTAPSAEALEITEKAGLLNMNGGDTSITRSNPSLTAVGALGIAKGGYLQVHAPITNENIYTNLWKGPFYGYERVIESFEMTERPRRLKPVDIYYHTYSTSKRAGLKALQKAHDWARTQPLHPVFASEFIMKVGDFQDIALARDSGGWRVRGNGNLRTLRLPAALGTAQLNDARGIAGFSLGSEGNYLHLGNAAAWFRTGPSVAGDRPWLRDANARLVDWQENGRDLSFRLQGHAPLEFTLANAARCQTRIDGRPAVAARSENTAGTISQTFRLDHAAAQIRLSCPPR
ncbi:MAG: bifunctional glycoside hydrolase 114/ polysaccharide deacetylase family protein [Azonexus sp.]|nr:bifunctional glycoside hydrolase 114/ polysaccharide deacetylase family protein [Azonexus sp.]